MRCRLVLVAILTEVWLAGALRPAAADPVQRPEGAERGNAHVATETTEGTEGEEPATGALRVSCERVISRINHEQAAPHGKAADMSMVAKQLRTTVTWVERCMLAYGRRPMRPGIESAEGREERLESFEDQEVEEIAPEDVAEPGARELKQHAEKERVSHLKAPPTPVDFRAYQEGE